MTDIIAFDDKEDVLPLEPEIDKETYLEDVFNKIDNIVRGLPLVKNIFFYPRRLFL